MSDSYRDLRVTVMGLGLHGGGVASAGYLADRGARVTVTDLRDEATLRPSISALREYDIRWVLGRHDEHDFRNADIVVKNPGVRRDSRYLRLAARIETDISIFLASSDNPLIVVTGSKGKSSLASALAEGFRASSHPARLGGNITVSPLVFVDELGPADPVILELSSFQLGDLELTGPDRTDRIPLNRPYPLQPRIAILTTILPDHMNYYSGMEPYIHDKGLVYRGLGPADWAVGPLDPTDPAFTLLCAAPGRHAGFSLDPIESGNSDRTESRAWWSPEGGLCRTEHGTDLILPPELSIPGEHMKRNLLAAGLSLRLYGLEADLIRRSLGGFTGIAHRMERLGRSRGVLYYNDSSATIPEATLASVSGLTGPIHLIAGGTDKNLDLGLFAEIASMVHRVYLLSGTATEKIIEVLDRSRQAYQGPYDGLESCLQAVTGAVRAGDTVLLSPGCASFGMFNNEFDRGDRFRKLVIELMHDDA